MNHSITLKSYSKMFDCHKDSKCIKCQLENEDLYRVIYECQACSLRARFIPNNTKPHGRHLQLNVTKLTPKNFESIEIFLLAVVEIRSSNFPSTLI